MNTTTTKSHTASTRQYALTEAQEAVIKLITLKPLLSSRDEETLSLLINKELMQRLKKSLKEAEKGKVEPLKNILK